MSEKEVSPGLAGVIKHLSGEMDKISGRADFFFFFKIRSSISVSLSWIDLVNIPMISRGQLIHPFRIQEETHL